MRNAISYCAMRVAISGSPNSCELQLVQLRRGRRGIAAARSPSIARRIRQVQHRIAAGAELHALILRRQKAAAPQPVVERLIAGLPLPCEIITTNAGRSWFSLPSP